MWIVRRRVELLLICSGIAILVLALDLPPPVGRTVVVTGQVSDLTVIARQLNFWVGKTKFTTSSGGAGWGSLRTTLRNGLSVRVEGWRPFLAGDDGRAEILQVETDAGSLLDRRRRLGVSWFFHSVVIALGLVTAGIGLERFRHQQTLAEMSATQGVVRAFPPWSARRRDRKRGTKETVAGLLLVYSPLLYALVGSLRGTAGVVFVILPLAGFYFASVGGHRLLFGRPMTRLDSIGRRITFTAFVMFFAVATFLLVAGLLAPMF